MTGHYWMSFDSLRRSFENGFNTGRIRMDGTPIRTSLENAFRNWDTLVPNNLTKECSKMPAFPHSDVWIQDCPFDKNVDDGELIMQFAMAGYRRENIAVQAGTNTLRIVAKTNSWDSTEGKKMIHHGISKKDIDFTLNIDSEFDPKKSYTSFEDGMLYITVPRSNASETVNLKIHEPDE